VAILPRILQLFQVRSISVAVTDNCQCDSVTLSRRVQVTPGCYSVKSHDTPGEITARSQHHYLWPYWNYQCHCCILPIVKLLST